MDGEQDSLFSSLRRQIICGFKAFPPVKGDHASLPVLQLSWWSDIIGLLPHLLALRQDLLDLIGPCWDHTLQMLHQLTVIGWEQKHKLFLKMIGNYGWGFWYMVTMWDHLALLFMFMLTTLSLLSSWYKILQYVSAGIILTPSVSHSILKYNPDVKLIYMLLYNIRITSRLMGRSYEWTNPRRVLA